MPGIQASQLQGTGSPFSFKPKGCSPSSGISVFPAVNWVVDSKAFKGPGCTGTPLSRQLLGRLTAGGSVHGGLSQPLWDSVPFPQPHPQHRNAGVRLSESQMLGSLNGFQKLPAFAATVEKISFFVIFKEKQAVMLFEV